MSFGGGGGGITTEINVTPLCDIFVVLLIIFMLTADNANQQGPAIDLPQRMDIQPDNKPELDICNITITKDLGKVYINGTPTNLEGLPALVQDAMGKIPDKSKRKVMVRTEPEIPLERVVKVMGIAHANGAVGIGLGTQVRQTN